MFCVDEVFDDREGPDMRKRGLLKFVIPEACTYGEPLCNEVGA